MTRILVAHGSKRGGTAEIAEWIGAELCETPGVVVDVRPAAEARDLAGYDAVVIGSAVYVGRWVPEARRFARRHRAALVHLPVWAFSSGPLDRSAQEGEVPPTRSIAKIVERVGARDHVTFGGRLTADAKGFVAARLAKERGGDYRDRDQIRAWARAIVKELQPTP
ncbi:flavodoxin [Actinomadura barringtoniae]|uniref:Flavodoxin n=1 Tax=Actinomadura barringtoniae TaxID=1427535 RepID=A0A939P6E3_9ACTN|nr:flavodoxin domain-containing protein [Actinomadura barringtoniae]MBO2446040.1 flavodoxin [Actinomadura barringtoniae]